MLKLDNLQKTLLVQAAEWMESDVILQDQMYFWEIFVFK